MDPEGCTLENFFYESPFVKVSRAVEENKWSKTWFNRSSFLWFFDLRNLRHFTPNETSWQPTHFTMQHSVEIILSENYVFTKNKFWISCIRTVKYLSFYKIEKSKIFYHYINQSRKRGFWLIGWIRFEVKSLHFDTIDAKRPPLDRLMAMKLGTGFTKIELQTTLKFFRAFLYVSKSLTTRIFALKSIVSATG